MPTYTLRRLVRPQGGNPEPEEAEQEIEARDDATAILNVQVQAAEFDGNLLEIELTDADDQVIWRLMQPANVP